MLDHVNKENENVIYKANQELVEMIGKTREKCHSICSKHFYRPVRVQTVNGETYDGRIMNIDNHYLYLETTPNTRQFPFYGPYSYGYGYNPYASTILPLVLFDLLTISLLY